jgi:hypothetical protein
MSALPTPAQNPEFRRTDRLRGLLIVGLTFVLCLLVSAWAKRRSMPLLSTPPGPPTTVGVVGFPAAVDAVKTLPRARQITPRALLRGVVAEGVKSDGTIDLTSPSGRVRYTFQSAPGEGPEPPREPGTLARRTYCGRQNVDLGKAGLVADSDAADAICSTHAPDPLPEPQCSLADVWAHALSRGVPKERLARIEYYRAGGGPAWRFDAPHARARFTLSGDCRRELDLRDAVNVAP